MRILRIVACSSIISFAFLLTVYSGYSGSRKVEGVAISYALAASSITLHEPVILNFTVTNSLAGSVTLNLGQGRKGAFQFSITQPNGTKVQLPGLSQEGIGPIPEFALGSGQTYEQSILLNEWFDFSTLGRYRIDVQLTTPIINQDRMNVAAGTKSSFYLEIRPMDSAHLKRVCEDIAAQVMGSSSYEEAAKAANVLSFINDPVAVPYLEETLHSDKMVEQYAINGLRKIGDNEAIRVLTSALKMRKGDAAILARSALLTIERKSTDPSIKEQIKQALSQP